MGSNGAVELTTACPSHPLILALIECRPFSGHTRSTRSAVEVGRCVKRGMYKAICVDRTLASIVEEMCTVVWVT